MATDFPNVERAWAQENPRLHPNVVCGAQMALRKGDLLARELYERCLARSKSYAVREDLGPNLLGEVIPEFGLPLNVFGTPASFYPIDWISILKLALPAFRTEIQQKINSAYFLAAYQSFFQYCGIDPAWTPPAGSYLRELYEKWAADRMRPEEYSPEQIISLVRGYLERNRDWAIPELIEVAGPEILDHLGMSAISPDISDCLRCDEGDQGEASGKTRYSRNQILSFLKDNDDLLPMISEELVQSSESQAVIVHNRDNNALVLRISPSQDGFCKDQYAARTFGAYLPIPEVVRIGKFDECAYFCLTTWAEGEQSNKLTVDNLNGALPNIHKTLSDMFKLDISFTSGYGRVSLPEGNAPHKSWREFVSESIDKDTEKYRQHARNMNIAQSIVDNLIFQYERNLNYASEVRRLLHGDPAHDNMLITDGRVTAIIDWSWLGYGDWMSDFATISFWWPKAYGDPFIFACEFDLEPAHIRERTALYWAINALRVIEWTDRHRNRAVYQWLHNNLERRLL
jgi:hygromycin-B 4-O-kinase